MRWLLDWSDDIQDTPSCCRHVTAIFNRLEDWWKQSYRFLGTIRSKEATVTTIEIPDIRSTSPEDYDHKLRRGRLKNSWTLGIAQQTDGTEGLSINDGLSWGSIGQILGYLLGEVDEEFQDDLYERMVDQFKLTDRGEPLR